MLDAMFRTTEAHWSALLLISALLCGLWALWPTVFPAPRVPLVSHTDLPLAQVIPQPTAAPEYPATASITPLISGRLNLNTATQEQLEALPKVGPALAERLIAGRPYRSLQDLDAVKGIGESLMQSLSPLVSF